MNSSQQSTAGSLSFETRQDKYKQLIFLSSDFGRIFLAYFKCFAALHFQYINSGCVSGIYFLFTFVLLDFPTVELVNVVATSAGGFVDSSTEQRGKKQIF